MNCVLNGQVLATQVHGRSTKGDTLLSMARIKIVTMELTKLTVPESIDESIVKLAYHMIAGAEVEVSKHPPV